jgi:sterol desaturase/sphingolipid hydroxylase (fatty acid hydroxylase superfamily)
MDALYIAAAIPVFFIAIAIELIAARIKKRRVYVYHDAIANLSNGVGQLVFGALFTALTIGMYAVVYERARVITLPQTWPIWLAIFPLVDLGFYAFHRASHRVNFLWAIHAVHHQSEEYNLSVALRQAWLEPAVAAFFYLPLAIVGFHPVMFATAHTLNTLYQFWVHTRLVGKLGPIEHVFNTASHHRVHHGRNPRYIDKNYAGMFILWDRVFSTFQVEDEEPVYGVVKPLHSFNPLWAQSESWVKIAALMAASKGLFERLSAPFRPPEWLPESMGGKAEIPDVKREGEVGWDTRAPLGVDIYVGVQFFLVALLVTGFLLTYTKMHTSILIPVVAWFIASMIAWGGLIERRRWAPMLEIARLLAGGVLLAVGGFFGA